MDIKTVLSGANTTYLLQLLEQFNVDPSSVDAAWHPVLQDLSQSFAREEKPSWGMSFDVIEKTPDAIAKSVTPSINQLVDSARAFALIHAYRAHGHIMANLNPLSVETADTPSILDPKTYGFSDKDYHHPIFVNKIWEKEFMTLTQIISKLQQIYCQKIGFEIAHIENSEQKEWLLKNIEQGFIPLDQERQKWLLKHLTQAEAFEKFLHVKYPGAKRFGLDGGESLIPALHTIIEQQAKANVQDIVFGMPHRGRLSTLCHILNMPMRHIFAQFDGKPFLPSDLPVSGDVKYHLGFSSDVKLNNQTLHLSLLPNPSHLEAVNPVVLGKARAKQDDLKDNAHQKVTSILMHGDAAFSGQGIVFESLSISQVSGYNVGGTFHIVVNNQIGFTTLPHDSRGTRYTTDTAKFIDAPIFHVNADAPESVLQVIKIACDFYQTFQQDVVIDLVCYRRFGHNEGDEPFFTQPTLYKNIQEHPSVRKLYETHLIAHGIITADEAQTIRDDVDYSIKAEYEAAQKQGDAPKPDWLTHKWGAIQACFDESQILKPIATGVDSAVLRAVGLTCHTPCDQFDLNSKIVRQWSQKREAINKAEGIDWALAESMAFGTLLIEGYPIRLTGQDSERGTFSHRHAVITDQTSDKKYIPLNHIQEGQETLSVINSPLSEFAVMGYEYGYSLENPNRLTIWEAQFGDFSNGAQIIIDQFISSAEQKWLRLSGLVILLPHGYEGQGPEHSSARLERYLQLCAQNNMIVANCSTPANYFHILRRQVLSPYRKPLIIMSPKSLLRHKLCVSSLKDMGKGTHFKTIIEDHLPKNTIKRIVLCSGKIYYDLREKQPDDVAIIRLEQLYPFPAEDIYNALSAYPKVPVVWCQEEPQNMGAWTFIDRRLEKVLTRWQGNMARALYAGRPESASTAAGNPYRHKIEQDTLIDAALGLPASF